MIAFKQGDPRWRNIKLGTCPTDTIGTSGCFITCLGCFLDKQPDEVNKLLTDQGGYSGGCLLITSKACEILGMTYGGKLKNSTNVVYPCIGETDHFAPNVPQHFFVMLSATEILDPLDGREKVNPYKVVSYRLFSKKDDMDAPKEARLAQLERFITLFTPIPERGLRSDGTQLVMVRLNHPDAVGELGIDGSPLNPVSFGTIFEAEAIIKSGNDRIATLEQQLSQPITSDPVAEEAKQQMGIVKAFFQLISKWFK